jgi:hypothetical protein
VYLNSEILGHDHCERDADRTSRANVSTTPFVDDYTLASSFFEETESDELAATPYRTDPHQRCDLNGPYSSMVP